jgi:hypothetical protein
MRVTFDSNVWRPAADPSRFPNDPEHEAFLKINALIKSGDILGVLCETIFTLEGIRRTDRLGFFMSYQPNINATERELADGIIQSTLSLASDDFAHPGNNSYLSSHLNDALAIGFRLMRCPRVSGVRNSDLKDEWFLPTTHSYVDKLGEVTRRLEAAGAGIAAIKAIGNRYAHPNEYWFDGLRRASVSEGSAVAAAVAEWADADSVAAHVASGNEFLCTNDEAVSAGATSTFSMSNRAWLSSDYGVLFLSPTELAKRF